MICFFPVSAANITGRTLPYFPTQPRRLRTTIVNSTTVALNWDAPAVSSGPIEYSQVLQDDVVVRNTTGQTINITGLAEFRAYQFHVRAVSFGGYVGPLSNSLFVRTDEGPPPLPILSRPVFNVDYPTQPRVALSWKLTSGRLLGNLLPTKVHCKNWCGFVYHGMH